MTRFLLIMVLMISPATSAGLQLGTPFGDRMVVQHDKPVRVWGWDEPGQKVYLRLAGKAVIATCDATGRFDAELPAPPLGESWQLAAEGTTAVRLSDVVAGEVWYCAGQSNMNFRLDQSAEWRAVQAAGPLEGVRMMRVAQRVAPQPRTTVDHEPWVIADPTRIARRSAVAFHFAREVHEATGRPVGIVQAAYGGTMLEAWTPAVHIDASPVADDIRAWWARWLQKNEPQMDNPTIQSRRRRFEPSGIHNAMQHPLQGLSIRGIVWYQGESNALLPERYEQLFPHTVEAWREGFGDDLPIITTQLPNYAETDDDWAAFREVQRRLADRLPNVEMAVTIDLGDAGDIHPKNKQDVGRRLANLAIAEVYGVRRDVSPRPLEARREDDYVVISFTQAGVLTVRDGDPLLLVNGHGQVLAATAEADGAVLRLSADLADPVEVRYAQSNDPRPSLFATNGLPVTPFVLPIE
jgi:sialate O-acetylesterase